MGAVFNQISGRFVSTGAARNINLGWIPDRFEMRNLTKASSVANPAVVKKAEWFTSMVSGEALVVKNTAGAATDESSLIASGGIYLFDSSVTGLDAAFTISSVSQAANAVVVTSAAHGYAVGDIVRLFDTTGQLQIGSMDFEILTVPLTTSFTIQLDSSAFAAAASAGSVRRLKSSPLYVPQRRFVTKISQAAAGVVTTSIAHGLQTGEYVRMHVPAGFGMVELDGQLAKVTRLTAYTFAMDINTSGYSAFVFPLSADVPFSFAEMIPVGSAALGAIQSSPVDPFNVLYVPGATFNEGFKGVQLGLSVVGAANDVIVWVASKSDMYVNMN